MILVHPLSAKPLLITMKNGDRVIAHGTGFVLKTTSGWVLVTARHNLTGVHQVTKNYLSPNGEVPDSIDIHHHSSRLGVWIIKNEPLKNQEIQLWREHPRFKKEADIAALPLTNLDDVKLYPFTFDDPPIKWIIGDRLNIVGFPYGKSGGGLGIWTTGYVATEPHVEYDGLPKFLVDSRTRQGQSGSPVILFRHNESVEYEYAIDDGVVGDMLLDGSTRSRLLGIYTGRISEDSDLGVVWKTELIKELVDSMDT